jgi:hypothetical protein
MPEGTIKGMFRNDRERTLNLAQPALKTNLRDTPGSGTGKGV